MGLPKAGLRAAASDTPGSERGGSHEGSESFSGQNGFLLAVVQPKEEHAGS